MRPSRGSRTSTNSVNDTSKTAGSKGGFNDASKKSARSNLGANKSNVSRKSGKEKNKDIVDIQPLVYSFRVPSNPSPGSVMNALLPPYWLFHDHAFGVIWMLFHSDKKYIGNDIENLGVVAINPEERSPRKYIFLGLSGIAQLHWCLRFLLDLKNTEGEYTGDVNVCIQAVQDNLIEQYANLGTALEQQESPKDKGEDPSSQNEKNNEKNKSGEKESKSDPKENPDSRKKDVGENESSPPLNSQQSKSSQLSACSSMNQSAYINAQSLTYNEMISRGPAPYTEQTPLEQIYRAGTSAAEVPTSTPDIAAMLTSDTSPPEIPLAEMGTEELVTFLNGSREEHVERIRKELERLHDLEKFMEGFDKQGFKAYVNDDLARRLDKLDGQGVVREVGTMLN